ncbi:MAG TPA: acetamidase/formamidase family protein [Anaerolineales bacterium]|nr:acetamidase/formamidase family protein [Anaerolineales bacterium]HLE05380.1 acetamidase/formamidase family protein [Anaerolineales bacterium]
MAVTISRDNVFFAFSPQLKAIARIEQGQEVLLQTHDCFEGQIRAPSDLVDTLDWAHVNPATGPLYISGAQPGDVLRIDLLEIQVNERSSMVAIPGEGALGDVITQMETSILKLEGGQVVFKDKVRVPARPMIGVIGVAPAEGEVPTGTPGLHGGNMDCKLMAAGNRVYFTVGVEGALFGAGDLHAAMGDGEIVVCGAETAGAVRFKADVVDLPGLPTPFVETREEVATIFSAPTLDESASGAIHNMAQFLTNFAGIPLNDAGMLMSLAGELKFCQVVDPLKTVRFEFPKAILAEYDFHMP